MTRRFHRRIIGHGMEKWPAMHLMRGQGRDAQPGAIAMFFSRMFALAAFASLAMASAAQAADTPAFSVMVNNSAGKPVMYQSTSALKKGDVLKVSAFNAQPVMILQIAMCDSDCPRMHLVKTISLTPYFVGLANQNDRFVLPENGRVAFWVQRIGGVASVPIPARGGTWSLQFVDPFLSFVTPRLYPDTSPTPANSLQLSDNTLHARFYHRTFVTVSLADMDAGHLARPSPAP
jgi:hypothetical protein